MMGRPYEITISWLLPPRDSWLHRRNPVTKLLAVLWLLIAAFLLPPLALLALAALVVVAAVRAGLLGELVRSLRIPAILFASILDRQRAVLPGQRRSNHRDRPVGLSWEGICFGVVSASRFAVVFLGSVLFLFTTLPDDLLEALVARGVSHRLAFVILSAVQLGASTPGTSVGNPRRTAGTRPCRIGSFRTRVRALVPLIGPIVLGSLIDVRERTFALEARAFGARPGTTRIGSCPTHRSTAGCAGR